MTDYTQSTSFTAKDALPSGHPGKKILGSLFDTEFNNISVAISTKLESGDSASFASGTVVSDFTFTDGEITTASPIFSLNNSVGINGTMSVIGDITTAGFVNGRAMSVDGAKLDGIEAGADVTDAANVDAAGAVMNSDATTASMSFVIDEDSFTSNLDTKVPTQQSVKAYVDATVVAIGGLVIDDPVAAGEFGVFTSASTIGGQTPAEVRASLDLEVGTDVQAYDPDTAKLDVVQTFTAAQTINSLTLGGELAGADNTVSRVNLKDYGEVTNAIGSTGGGTQDIDLTLGNVVSATVDTSTNTFTFSNPTASDEGCGFTLVLTNGGSQTVNWPASVDWAGATAPTLTASGVDILVFYTIDGGTTWFGNLVGAAYA